MFGRCWDWVKEIKMPIISIAMEHILVIFIYNVLKILHHLQDSHVVYQLHQIKLELEILNLFNLNHHAIIIVIILHHLHQFNHT
jgi:hypothetical protein